MLDDLLAAAGARASDAEVAAWLESIQAPVVESRPAHTVETWVPRQPVADKPTAK